MELTEQEILEKVAQVAAVVVDLMVHQPLEQTQVMQLRALEVAVVALVLMQPRRVSGVMEDLVLFSLHILPNK